MSDQPRFSVGDDGTSRALAVSRSLLVAAIVFFLSVLAFVFLLHIYARWRWGSRRRVAWSRTVFGADRDQHDAPAPGLDPSVLQSIPVRVYKAEEFKEGVECAVCLSELIDGEKLRLLPKCNHGFHVDCIDMWFFSHSTCPLCRNAVGKGEARVDSPLEETAASGRGTETSDVPTNVLFWGNQNQMGAATHEAATAAACPSASGSSSSGKRDGVLVIDIPRRAFTADDFKSPAALTTTPTPTRLASLTRFLSREKRVGNCSSSCSSPHDLELGITGDVHKTATDF